MGPRRGFASVLCAALLTACAQAEGDPLPAPATVAGIEELGDLTLPEAARDIEVSAVGDTASRRAVFTLPTEALEPWCRDLGLGQLLVRARELEPADHERFGIEEDVKVGDARTCEGSAPDDPRIQRAVIATGAEHDEATVHLVVEVWPLR